MGGFHSRRNAGVEEVDTSATNAYRYPPKSGREFVFSELCSFKYLNNLLDCGQCGTGSWKLEVKLDLTCSVLACTDLDIWFQILINNQQEFRMATLEARTGRRKEQRLVLFYIVNCKQNCLYSLFRLATPISRYAKC